MADSAASRPEPGLGQVGRYRLVDRVAVTAMSEVFRAEVTDHDGVVRRVAVKRVRHDLATSDEMKQMFLDEAAIARSLEHGNVVRTLDFGMEDDAAFLVMELVDGWDLGRILARGGPPSLGVILFVAREVLEGLAHIHGRTGPDGRTLGLVHRDISVENVLCTREGEVKIADFGIAKARTNRALTGPGIMKGKVGSMSPEQVLGRPLDGRSDLFSVGVVLYRMLTGHQPFEAPTDSEVLVKTTKGEFTPIPEEVPEPIRALTEAALAPDPASRPQSAGEMLHRIEEIAESLGTRMSARALRECLLARMEQAGKVGLDGILRRAAIDRAAHGQTVPSKRRARWPIVVLAVGGALALGLFSLALVPSGGTPDRTTGSGRDDAAEDDPEPPVEVVREETVQPVPEVRSTTAAPEAVADVAPRDSARPSKAAAGFATLHVNVVPWARVTLDGVVVDEETPTPPGGIRIRAGPHTLLLENPTGLTKRKYFSVEAGESYRVSQW